MTIPAADQTSKPTALDDACQRYLGSQQRGRLATVGPDGAPQNKPVGFTYNAELGTIDIAGLDMTPRRNTVGWDQHDADITDRHLECQVILLT